MKQISAKQLALSFTGMMLGAGFVSGQELWQFFACFGPIGLVGFLGMTVIFAYVNYASLRLVQTTGQEDMGRMFTPGDRPKLRLLVSSMQCLLLFGVSIIMIAGAATLIHQLIGLPVWLGGLLFTTLVVAVAMMGMHGLVATFSLLVPVTTVCALILGVVTLAKGNFQFAPPNGSVSALVPNWIIGFLTYAAYNLFGCVSVLVPLAKFIPEEKTVRRGLTGGSGLLILLAWSIIAALAVQPSAGAGDLPMAVLAGQLHPVLEIGYGLLMGFGMFSACLAAMTASVNQIAIRWTKMAIHHKPFTTVLLYAAWALSLLGFGNLIGVVYPIFGYASVPFLICLVINWHKKKKTL
ncbi:MAG: hypothetical protein J6J51_00870 [Clostridia bacterium]|nr:hypothetical protein [Clostridia bacterium]